MSLEPEFRRDPVIGRWAVVAPERSTPANRTEKGPNPATAATASGSRAPFCPGQEHDTPHRSACLPPIQVRPPMAPAVQAPRGPQQVPAVRPDVGKRSSLAAVEGMVFVTTPGLGPCRGADRSAPNTWPEPNAALRRAEFAAVSSVRTVIALCSLAEDPSTRLRRGVQECRGGSGGIARPHALADHRHADRARGQSRLNSIGGRSVLRSNRAVRLLRSCRAATLPMASG